MRKIVKSSFLVCSFYKYTAKLCFILQSAKFFAKITQNFTKRTFCLLDTISRVLIFTPCLVNLT